MPHGFFTVEEWQPPRKGAKPQWIPILHLDSYQSLTRAIESLERRGQPGLFKVVQTQRCLWGELENGKLRLHGSHASSPESLERLTKIFRDEGGRRPVEKARQERAKVKIKQGKK